MLVEHHVKYKEIHGVDETVWIDKGKHIVLHRRLRREGKCRIPIDQLNKISKRAYARTKKGKENEIKYRVNPKRVNYNINYKKENTYTFTFSEVVMPNVELNESWYYNKVTNVLLISSGFRADHGKNLLFIEDLI